MTSNLIQYAKTEIQREKKGKGEYVTQEEGRGEK